MQRGFALAAEVETLDEVEDAEVEAFCNRILAPRKVI